MEIIVLEEQLQGHVSKSVPMTHHGLAMLPYTLSPEGHVDHWKQLCIHPIQLHEQHKQRRKHTEINHGHLSFLCLV